MRRPSTVRSLRPDSAAEARPRLDDPGQGPSTRAWSGTHETLQDDDGGLSAAFSTPSALGIETRELGAPEGGLATLPPPFEPTTGVAPTRARAQSVRTEVEVSRRSSPPRPAILSAGPYELGRRLGEEPGGVEVYLGEKRARFGVVQRARVKRVLVTHPTYAAGRDRLFAEAERAAGFEHENLPALLDAGEDAHGAFAAFEHVEGVSLDRLLAALRARHQALPFELAAHLVLEACRGVEQVHHLASGTGREALGDLAPAGLLVGAGGAVKIAAVRGQGQPFDPTARGGAELAFVAPELLAGEEPEPGADVYSLGVLLAELCAGRPCLAGQTPAELEREVLERGLDWNALEREGTPAELVQLIAQATEPDASERLARPEALAEALEEWLLSRRRLIRPELLASFLTRHGLLTGRARERREARGLMMRVVRGASVRVTEAPIVEPLSGGKGADTQPDAPALAETRPGLPLVLIPGTGQDSDEQDPTEAQPLPVLVQSPATVDVQLGIAQPLPLRATQPSLILRPAPQRAIPPPPPPPDLEDREAELAERARVRPSILPPAAPTPISPPAPRAERDASPPRLHHRRRAERRTEARLRLLLLAILGMLIVLFVLVLRTA